MVDKTVLSILPTTRCTASSWKAGLLDVYQCKIRYARSTKMNGNSTIDGKPKKPSCEGIVIRIGVVSIQQGHEYRAHYGDNRIA